MAVDDGAFDVVRSEEELRARHEVIEAGRVRVRKRIESEPFVSKEQRGIEHAVIDRVAVDGDDDGEVITLEDGSVSIPVLEEEVIVTKRVVVRERLIIRKQTEYAPVELRGELRHEEVDVEVDESIAERVTDSGRGRSNLTTD
jgi:uncharacterized protein (TIGR02271 family)